MNPIVLIASDSLDTAAAAASHATARIAPAQPIHDGKSFERSTTTEVAPTRTAIANPT